MAPNRKMLLNRIRTVSILMMAGVFILSVESLLIQEKAFQSYALGLAVFGLVVISLMVARAAKNED